MSVLTVRGQQQLSKVSNPTILVRMVHVVARFLELWKGTVATGLCVVSTATALLLS